MCINVKRSLLRLLHCTQCWSSRHTRPNHVVFNPTVKYFSSLKEDRAAHKQPHMFFRLSQWKSIEQLANSLMHNIVYDTSGLVVVNKPYGVASSTPPLHTADKKNVLALNYAQASDCSYTLSQALPYLEERLGYKHLAIVKAPERYTSGVTLLSATDEVTSRVRQALKRSKPTKRRTERYLAVAIGVPNENETSNKFGIVLKTDERKDYKYPVLVTDWSNRAVQRGEIKLVSVDHRVLAVDPGGLASLVEVCPSATRWHFIRVFLTQLLSPALGDHMYGSRVASVMGVPVLIDPASDNARLPQKLSDKVLSALGLSVGEQAAVPTHIHLHSQTLIGYDGGTDLTLRAPVPEHFQATCRALGLELPAFLLPPKQLEP